MSKNIRGILLMTLAMVFLAIGDATIKSMSGDYDRPVFMIVAGLGLVVLCIPVARRQNAKLLDRRALWGAPLVRSIAEVVAASAMIIALGRVPFTVLTLVMQAIPLFVAFGAVLFFKEKIGPRRWSAIILGILGVAIVLRPTNASFSPDWFLALAAAFALATRDLCSRAVPKHISTIQISAWGALSVFVGGMVFQLAANAPFPVVPLADFPAFLLIIICWGGGMLSVTEAMRSGDVGVVAPFRYMRLPFGILIGVLYFGEMVDGFMLLGVGIIVASGLYVLFRETKT